MNEGNFMKKIQMDCPICDKEHELEMRMRHTEGIVKGVNVDYDEVFLLCPVTDEEENEFVHAKMMDENLLRARDAYRIQKGLLPSFKIAEIRKSYGLTQSDFSNLLGWGDVTVTRYESKTIQDETYDRLMRMANDHPLFILQNLEQHKNKFTQEKYEKIRSKIVERISAAGIQYLKLQEIESVYAAFNVESEYNGNKLLDLDKLSMIMGYFANHINYLYKVKLMKLLWYSDVLYYRRYGSSMTGLVYKHMTYGALPLAYEEIITLPGIKVEEEILSCDIAYKIVSNKNIDESEFTKEEISVLNLIVSRFKNHKAKEIVEYMHKERAYREVDPYKLISYEIAKDLRELR